MPQMEATASATYAWPHLQMAMARRIALSNWSHFVGSGSAHLAKNGQRCICVGFAKAIGKTNGTPFLSFTKALPKQETQNRSMGNVGGTTRPTRLQRTCGKLKQKPQWVEVPLQEAEQAFSKGKQAYSNSPQKVLGVKETPNNSKVL